MIWQHALAVLLLITMFGVMAWLITHARTETIYKPIAMVVFFIGFPATYASMSVAMGTPKPAMMFNVIEEGNILGFKPVTGKAIHVLLEPLDGGVPVYYVLPWSSETAEKIEQALREGKGQAKLRFKSRKSRSVRGIFDLDWPWDIPEPEVLIEPTESKMPEKDAGDPLAGMRLAPGNGND
jgi:hypothetical protein